MKKQYTLTADFALGSGINVNYNDPAADQVQLNGAGTPFEFIWVAESGKGAAVKIDTNDGTILGEYRTTPSFQSAGNPSRTTVDHDGSVWLTNRNDVYSGMGSVLHIGLKENGQCQDRNNNGIIETSTGLDDVLPWDVPLDKQGEPNLALYAEDECIIHYVKVNSKGTRHVSVNDDNDVWVSGSGLRKFDLIKGGGPTVAGAGQIIRSEQSVGYGGYGGLISGDVIWSANPLLRWNTTLSLSGSNGDPNTATKDIGPPPPDKNWSGQSYDSYGLCVDKKGNVWNTMYGGGAVSKYAPDGTFLGDFSQGNSYSQGCVVDSRSSGTNDVWVAHSLNNPAAVGHLSNEGVYLGTVDLRNVLGTAYNQERGTTGVAVDAKGKIWATNYYSDSVTRIDPALNGGLGAADLRVYLGAGAAPYDYSDMTGSTNRAAPTTGSWAAVVDSEVAGHDWQSMSVFWSSNVPQGTSLEVKASSSEDGNTYSSESVVAASGSLLGDLFPDGRYLRINVLMRRDNSESPSPVLRDLTVAEGCLTDDDCGDFEKGECGVGKCNAATGACFTSLDSTMCTPADPNNACDANDVCGQDGKCVITFKPRGAPCDDHKLCTRPDTCDGKGVCVGGNPQNCKSVCRKVAKTCGTVAQCCSYANKVCEGPVGGQKKCQVCHALNTPCSRSTQCCSSANKACDGPSSTTKTCKVCLARRARCTRTSQCCPGLTCKGGASSSKRYPALVNGTSAASIDSLGGNTSAGSTDPLCGSSLKQCLP